jgi:hypothetical protein
MILFSAHLRFHTAKTQADIWQLGFEGPHWMKADLFDDQSFDVPWTVTDLYLSAPAGRP